MDTHLPGGADMIDHLTLPGRRHIFRRIMDGTTIFIGLDVHKATIAVAIAEGGRRGAARYFGGIENTSAALSKLAKKYGRANARLSFCYEAGRCS